MPTEKQIERLKIIAFLNLGVILIISWVCLYYEYMGNVNRRHQDRIVKCMLLDAGITLCVEL